MMIKTTLTDTQFRVFTKKVKLKAKVSCRIEAT
jgi:hypothetical protein